VSSADTHIRDLQGDRVTKQLRLEGAVRSPRKEAEAQIINRPIERKKTKLSIVF